MELTLIVYVTAAGYWSELDVRLSVRGMPCGECPLILNKQGIPRIDSRRYFAIPSSANKN